MDIYKEEVEHLNSLLNKEGIHHIRVEYSGGYDIFNINLIGPNQKKIYLTNVEYYENVLTIIKGICLGKKYPNPPSSFNIRRNK